VVCLFMSRERQTDHRARIRLLLTLDEVSDTNTQALNLQRGCFEADVRSNFGSMQSIKWNFLYNNEFIY
jgi:hypothetical protein